MKISELLNSFSAEKVENTDKAETTDLENATGEIEESDVNAQEEEKEAVDAPNEDDKGIQEENESEESLSSEDMEKLEQLMESMSERIKALTEENEELKGKLNSLNTDTKNKEDKIDDLLTRFENLLQESKPQQKEEKLSSKGNLHGFGVENL